LAASTTKEATKGLQDIVAGESSVCLIDAKTSRLVYRGYDAAELSQKATFEETAYLLLHGKLPNQSEYKGFKEALVKERKLPHELVSIIQEFPKSAHPMAALRTGVSLLSLFDPESDDLSPEANLRKVYRLLAQIPMIVAFFQRHRTGQKLVQPKLEADVLTAENFLYMFKGADPEKSEARILDAYFILLAEHDFNASTFAARTTASTLSDIYSALTTGIGTLKGDLHGSANSRAMETLVEIGTVDRVESFVDEALAQKRKLMGFGHRVYKGADPRATALRKMAKDIAKDNAEQAKWYEISEKLEKTVLDRKGLHCNVDFYSASVLYTLGIPIDLFTDMFAISRAAGWSAHVLEQYANNRLIRPISHYTGNTDLSYTPIADRK